MPKKAYLASHFSSDELQQKYFQTKDCVESRRWHLLWKISCGWTIKNSALAVGINYDYAKEILRKYNHLAANGIVNRKKKRVNPSGGKKRLLTSQQLQKLAQQLESTPADGGVWTGPKVARWIEKETKKEKVWNQRGWDYLKKLSYSCQSPRSKHKKGDHQQQEKFIQDLPSKMKTLEEKYPEAQVDLWCLGARSLASYADAGSHRFLMSIELV